MEEDNYKTKKTLVIEYILHSFILFSATLSMGVASIFLNLEKIPDLQIRLVGTLAFISFVFVMARIMITSLTYLIDIMRELDNGEYV